MKGITLMQILIVLIIIAVIFAIVMSHYSGKPETQPINEPDTQPSDEPKPPDDIAFYPSMARVPRVFFLNKFLPAPYGAGQDFFWFCVIIKKINNSKILWPLLNQT